MARLLWIPKILRAADLSVICLDGWETRGRADIVANGIVCHHTATSRSWSNARVANLLRDGRSDLSGPLSQLGLQRDGIYVMVAAGRANHNGYGTWGNDSIGIEAYNDGRGEQWNRVQMDAYARGCAALCAHLNYGVTRVKGHKETDPGRKIDPTFDMHEFRMSVERHLNPHAPTPLGDTDMIVYHYTGTADLPAGKSRWIAVSGGATCPISGSFGAAHKAAGVPVVPCEDLDDYLKVIAEFSG